MSSENASPADAVLSPSARQILDAQDAAGQRRMRAAIEQVMRDPRPDGVTKALLGPPYPPGTVGIATPDYWVTYRFLTMATVEVLRILPWEEFLTDPDS